jgi:hypothetical protein
MLKVMLSGAQKLLLSIHHYASLLASLLGYLVLGAALLKVNSVRSLARIE